MLAAYSFSVPVRSTSLGRFAAQLKQRVGLPHRKTYVYTQFFTVLCTRSSYPLTETTPAKFTSKSIKGQFG